MLLEVRGVWFSYPGGSFTLRNVSFYSDSGEVVAIVGPIGCGKTTLLLIASGLIKPDRGEVLFRGVSLEKQLPMVRRNIGFVFQDPDDQLFNPTVFDELAFSLRQLGYSEGEVDGLVRDFAGRFGLDELLNRSPYKLSSGEKKKVALASVLIYGPELLFLDEPTSNLSASVCREIESIILNMKKTGKSIVVASHNVEFVMRVADRVYVMYNGEVVGGGSIADVIGDVDLLRVADMESPLAVEILRFLGVALEDDVFPLTRDRVIELLRRRLSGDLDSS